MVNTKGQFRWLVTAMVAVEIVSGIVSFATESSLPVPLREYQAAQLEAEWTTREIALVIGGIPLLIAIIVSVVGLYCFWGFARPLMVIIWIVVLTVGVVAGPDVESGLATSLYDLATLLNGIIL